MGRGVLGGLAVLVLVAAAAISAATGSAEATVSDAFASSRSFVPGEVIVRFRPGVAARARAQVAEAENAAVQETLLAPATAVLKLAAGENVADAVAAFERRPDVAAAQPNFVYHAETAPADPFFSVLWGLNNTGQEVGSAAGIPDADIDAPEAWDLSTGSNAVRVAVVDTGVEYDHPDLVGNIAELGPDYYAGDADPRDENGHGTHVAGTIGARSNGVGVVGVNWFVGLMPIRVLGPTASGTTATITNGLAYAARNGAHVVNASLGGRAYDPLMASTIAAAPNTLFVVAAGNGGGDGVGDDNDAPGAGVYPCNYEAANLLCVAATDSSDGLASFSNYGTRSVDVGAPGVKVGSTYVAGDYVYLQGTSMAAPHVAGVAALLLARDPTATVERLRGALLGSVDVVAPLQGRVASSGRLNAHRALLALSAAAAPPPPAVPPRPSSPPQMRRPVRKVIRKVTVCFRKRTITISRTKLTKYRKKGAKLGPCRKTTKKKGK